MTGFYIRATLALNELISLGDSNVIHHMKMINPRVRSKNKVTPCSTILIIEAVVENGVNTTDDEDSLIYSRDHCQKFSQSRALSQLTFFTCSKSTIEILKKCVKYVQT